MVSWRESVAWRLSYMILVVNFLNDIVLLRIGIPFILVPPFFDLVYSFPSILLFPLHPWMLSTITDNYDFPLEMAEYVNI